MEDSFCSCNSSFGVSEKFRVEGLFGFEGLGFGGFLLSSCKSSLGVSEKFRVGFEGFGLGVWMLGLPGF